MSSYRRGFGFRRSGRPQLVLSTRQLATLVKAGMPLLRSLRTVSDQLDPGALRDVFALVANDVEAGVKLSEALSSHPRWFAPFYVNMVRAGEVGGLLDEILKRLAELLEKQQRIRERVKSALMYPAFVMVAAVGILIVLMAFVVPTFLGMFTELGSALPLPTRILVGACTAVRQWWWMVLLGLGGLWGLLRLIVRTPPGRRLMDQAVLQAPVIGSLFSLMTRNSYFCGKSAVSSSLPLMLTGLLGLVVSSNTRIGRCLFKVLRIPFNASFS